MTDAATIRHLWTHKTQDHPWLTDEELVVDHAEGVWLWTERGKKPLCITASEVDQLVAMVADSIEDLQHDIEKGNGR